MNEERYDLMKDTAEKAITAKGYHHKNGHSTSKNFNNYTEKQCKEKNGPTLVFNKPISYSNLMSFPDSVQKDYILDLIERYSPSSGDLSSLFGVRVKDLFAHLKEIGIETYTVPGIFDKEGWELFVNTDTFPHKALSWADFKNLESDYDRKNYIQWVIKEYGLTTLMPFTKMFGISYYSMHSYFRKHCPVSFGRGSHSAMTFENIKRFNSFIGLEETASESDSPVEEKPEAIVEPNSTIKAPEIKKTLLIPDALSLIFNDKISPNDIAGTLVSIFGDEIDGIVEIKVTKRKE